MPVSAFSSCGSEKNSLKRYKKLSHVLIIAQHTYTNYSYVTHICWICRNLEKFLVENEGYTTDFVHSCFFSGIRVLEVSCDSQGKFTSKLLPIKTWNPNCTGSPSIWTSTMCNQFLLARGDHAHQIPYLPTMKSNSYLLTEWSPGSTLARQPALPFGSRMSKNSTL